MVRLLLDKGADVEMTTIRDWTPLHAAAYDGHTEIGLMLLEKGAQIDVPKIDGWTPLHEACQHGRVEFAELRLEKGREKEMASLEDNMHRTPLYLAAQRGVREWTRLQKVREGGNASCDEDPEFW